jgi:hypothetical protein
MGMRPVDPGAPVADRHLSPASQRLGHQEQVAHPVPHILIVLARRPPGRRRQGWGDLSQQLSAGLVQADLGAARVIGAGGDPTHVLHPPDELAVLLGRDAPALGQPRLEPVCFKTCRTVSYDTDSTTPNATSRSASSRTLQRLWPSGGALQVNATNRASCSPSSRRR